MGDIVKSNLDFGMGSYSDEQFDYEMDEGQNSAIRQLANDAT